MKNQKLITAILLFLFIVILLLQSCVSTDKVTNSKIIQKRKYIKGFYVNTIRNKIKTKKNFSLDKQKLKDTGSIIKTYNLFESSFENNKKDSVTNCNNLIASTKEIPILVQKNKLPSVDPLSKIHKPNKIHVKRIFNKCRKDLVPQPLLNKQEEKPKVLPLAIMGFSLSIIGLLCLLIFKNFFWLAVISGLIIELAALIVSIISLNKINRNPAKIKGKSVAELGLILSSIFIFYGLLFSILLFGFLSLDLGFALFI